MKSKRLTLEEIKNIFISNIMEGRIEIGYMYWIPQFIMDGNLRFLIEKAGEIEGSPSNIPSAKTREELLIKIDKLSIYLFNLQENESRSKEIMD